MKKNFWLALFLLIFIKNDAQNWNLVWSDEFDGTTVNTDNWNFETGGSGWGNNELEYYTDRSDNASILNGNLIIVAKEESYQGNNYTSARMNTLGLQSWTYGKIEARMKLPSGQGMWPAFWIMGEDFPQVGWPKCGEVDIMEHINNDTKIEGTMHWDYNGHVQSGGSVTCDVSQYHVYSLEWDKNAFIWLVDGKQYFTGSIANNINGTDEFHAPFFIILNLAVGGNWPGNPDNTTTFPDTMFVDYVRVYEQSTDIKKIKAKSNSISIFPNPTTNKLIIQANNSLKNQKFEIVNVLGKNILYGELENQTDIDISQFSKGVYFIKFSNDSKSEIRKFVKE